MGNFNFSSIYEKLWQKNVTYYKNWNFLSALGENKEIIKLSQVNSLKVN